MVGRPDGKRPATDARLLPPIEVRRVPVRRVRHDDRASPPARDQALATRRGLRIGDTLARGRQLYGRAFTMSPAQGGTWGVRTAGGRIDGYAWGAPKDGAVSPQSVVATVDAGDVGCPAVSP